MLTDFLRRTILGKKGKFIFKGYNEGLIDFSHIEDPAGLYIHIPFCKTICPYCPYNKVVYETGKAKQYKEALIKELALYNEHLQGRQITSIYIGGGTPALLIEELEEVTRFIKDSFNFNGEIGIELYPADVDEKLLNRLKKAGIELVSIGVQTFNNGLLRFLGRRYGEEEVDKALFLLTNYGFKCIDVDIMTNLPGQTIEQIKYDIKRSYDYEIDQLSVYPLIVFPMTHMGKVIKQNGLSRFNGLQEFKILSMIDEISEEYGYKRSSVWTYGKDTGNRYTSVTRENFIGFGAGASSLYGNYFYLNTFNVDEYINAVNQGKKPINVVSLLTEKEKMIFWIFWRCYDGVIDQERFEALFNKDMKKEFRLLFTALKLFGMTKDCENKVVLTNLGRYAYHFVEKQYSIHYLNHLWQKSLELPWLEEVRL